MLSAVRVRHGRHDFIPGLDDVACWWWATEGGQRPRHGEAGDWAARRQTRPVLRPGWFMRPFYYEFDFGKNCFRVPLRRHRRDGESLGMCELVTEADLTTKLFQCAYKGQTKRLLTCLSAGACINAVDMHHPAHLSPVLWAACGGSPRTLWALAEMGADFEAKDINDGHALHLAAAHGNVEAAAAVYNITDGNLYARDKQYRLALHLACLEGHADVVRLLVDLGSNVNAKDCRQDTPLHLACLTGHLRTVQTLIWWGADAWSQNILGEMPIDVAEREQHRDVYYLLESVMGEKCIFDRLPDAMFSCGQRHPDEPVELYHREHAADLAPYAAPPSTPWTRPGGAASKPAGCNTTALTAGEIYSNPKLWDKAIKTTVDIFPGAALDSRPRACGRGGEECDKTAASQATEGHAVEDEASTDSIGDWDDEWITYGVDPTRR